MTAAAAAERPPDDAELARRIGQRDERAFETLMRAHNRMLYRLARSILKDDAEAEDAVQEAYLAAYRNIAGFRGGARLSTWLARIVSHACDLAHFSPFSFGHLELLRRDNLPRPNLLPRLLGRESAPLAVLGRGEIRQPRFSPDNHAGAALALPRLR